MNSQFLNLLQLQLKQAQEQAYIAIEKDINTSVRDIGERRWEWDESEIATWEMLEIIREFSLNSIHQAFHPILNDISAVQEMPDTVEGRKAAKRLMSEFGSYHKNRAELKKQLGENISWKL